MSMGGIDWLYLAAGDRQGGGGMARPSTRREAHDEDTSTGCMCAVFQLFDFQVPLNHSSNFQLSRDPANTATGMEDPGNTLELKKPLATMEQENLSLPAGFQIKTTVSSSDSNSRTEDLSTECSAITSPETKTPNLVARLMGLDLLPECSSPSLYSSNSGPSTKSLRKDITLLQVRTRKTFSEDDVAVGIRSLPETPRMSSARRSDSEYNRLSLQINRENIKEEFKLPGKNKMRTTGRFRQQVQNENRSPGHYAKQIVKQIKESVNRRVGLDITNVNRNKHQDVIRKDENLIPLKTAKKNSRDSPKLGEETSSVGKQSDTLSWSPKLGLFDTNRNKHVTNSGNKKPRISTSSSDNHQSPGSSNSSKHNLQVTMQEDKQQRDVKKFGSGKSYSSLKKAPHQTYDHAIRKKKEEPYVYSATNKANLIDKKSKKAPLSNELVNTSGLVLLPVNKHSSPPATKLPRKQAQISSKTSHSYKQLYLQTDKIFDVEPGKTSRCATAGFAAAEYRHYIQWILNRSGIVDIVTPLNWGKWHTATHPLDPSIFYYLELFHPASAVATAALSRRCNRKLIFQLVDELLADILRTHLDFRRCISPVASSFALIDELCNRIERFPAANCQVLEDIDSLIGKDFGKSKLIGHSEEEWEGLLCEIEGEILDSIVHETVAMVAVRAAEV